MILFLSPLLETYLQVDYGSEVLLTLVGGVITFVFFILYWEYIRKRPLQPASQVDPEKMRQRMESASFKTSSVVASVLQNLPKEFRIQQCPSCGHPIRPSAKFCDNCGKVVVLPEDKTCPKCGTTLSSTAKFCGNCGSAI